MYKAMMLAVALFAGCEAAQAADQSVPACGALDFVAACSSEFAYPSFRDGVGICFRTVDPVTGVAEGSVTGCMGTKGAVTVKCASYCY
jgi:hypothetical protein